MGRFNSEAVRSSYILRRLFKKVSLVFYQIRRGLTEREGFPGNASKEPACKCRRHVTCRFNPWVRKIPWQRAWQPTPVVLPGKSHGQRSLVGYNPWGHERVRHKGATEHTY